MTTIISNGFYLVGDHRTTSMHSLRREKRLLDVTTGEPLKKSRKDTSIKIHVFEEHEIFEGKEKILAAGFSGSVEAIDKAVDIINSLKGKGVDMWTIDKIIQKTLPIKAAEFSAVYINSKNESIKKFYKSDDKDTFLYKNGELSASGTGSTVINFFKKVIPDLSIQDAIILASAYDKGTSPTYSVYGVREKEFYACIDIPNEERFKRLKQLQKQFLDHKVDFAKCLPHTL